MERCLTRPADRGHTLGRLVCWSFLRVSHCCWRYPKTRKSLIIAGACFLYLLYSVEQVSQTSEPGVRRPGHWSGGHGGFPEPVEDSRVSAQKTSSSPSPTRANVVYITLKSKRHKPAILRGTVRPKVRKKKLRRRSQDAQKPDGGPWRDGEGGWRGRRTNSSHVWTQITQNGVYVHEGGVFDDGTDDSLSSIRIYSQRTPPWFSQEDITSMRFLADRKISHVKVLAQGGSPHVLLFNSGGRLNQTQNADGPMPCDGGCGAIKRPVDISEVFAFHLDRVLGLNRSLPTVSRRFQALDGQLCPVTRYDPSVTAIAEALSEKLTWASYQNSLQRKCWQRGAPKPEWGCTPIHHHEWSRLALFDFLLQIHQRLDRNCCGFKPRPEDSCVQLGYHGHCGDISNVELSHIVHHRHDPHHLIFINNRGFFDRDEDNLDFKLLEGIKELPEVAVGVLSSQRLREKLLQSLFMDQQYWDSQGGRQGIEKLIDVIERRAKVLLRYINAHGIKIIPMNA